MIVNKRWIESKIDGHGPFHFNDLAWNFVDADSDGALHALITQAGEGNVDKFHLALWKTFM